MIGFRWKLDKDPTEKDYCTRLKMASLKMYFSHLRLLDIRASIYLLIFR